MTELDMEKMAVLSGLLVFALAIILPVMQIAREQEKLKRQAHLAITFFTDRIIRTEGSRRRMLRLSDEKLVKITHGCDDAEMIRKALLHDLRVDVKEAEEIVGERRLA